MQLIDKFTDWNESHKSDILCCRNQTCHSQRTAMLHLTSQVISTDNYSSAENWHIQVKSEPSTEEHPQQALEEEMALRVTALPFESLISLHHTYKNIIHKMKSCSAAIPRNVGILTTPALVFRIVWVPDASQSNYATTYSCSPTIRYLMNATWTQEINRPINKAQPTLSRLDFPAEDTCALTAIPVFEVCRRPGDGCAAARRRHRQEERCRTANQQFGFSLAPQHQAQLIWRSHRLSCSATMPALGIHCFLRAAFSSCSLQAQSTELLPSQLLLAVFRFTTYWIHSG